MALDEAELFYLVVVDGATAEQGPVFLIFDHLVPQQFASFFFFRDALEEDGGRAEGMGDLVRQPADDFSVRPIKLGPALLKHHHPDLALPSRLREKWFSFLVGREEIVDNHLLVNPVV